MFPVQGEDKASARAETHLAEPCVLGINSCCFLSFGLREFLTIDFRNASPVRPLQALAAAFSWQRKDSVPCDIFHHPKCAVRCGHTHGEVWGLPWLRGTAVPPGAHLLHRRSHSFLSPLLSVVGRKRFC